MPDTARQDVLAATEQLMYRHGIQAVSIDRIRAESGVPLNRLYAMFSAKDGLVLAYLKARDERWLASVTAAVHAEPEPYRAVLELFDWLGRWAGEPGYRGCAFTNSFAELGRDNAAVTEIVLEHKAKFRQLIGSLTSALRLDGRRLADHRVMADQLFLLAEGAIGVAALGRGPQAMCDARRVAESLLQAHGLNSPNRAARVKAAKV
jgi:AcrR family transcriptional regulator